MFCVGPSNLLAPEIGLAEIAWAPEKVRWPREARGGNRILKKSRLRENPWAPLKPREPPLEENRVIAEEIRRPRNAWAPENVGPITWAMRERIAWTPITCKEVWAAGKSCFGVVGENHVGLCRIELT